MPRGIVVTMLYSTSVYSGEEDTREAEGGDGGRDAVCRMLSSQPCSNCISLFSIPVIVTHTLTHTHTRAHKLLAHPFVTRCFESTTSTEGGREGNK